MSNFCLQQDQVSKALVADTSTQTSLEWLLPSPPPPNPPWDIKHKGAWFETLEKEIQSYAGNCQNDFMK